MRSIDVERRLALGKKMALACGESAKQDFFTTQRQKYFKTATQEIVTDTDLSVQRQICNSINTHFPADGIFSEEDGNSLDNLGRPTWIIDPIDGSSNFSSQRPFWAVSIALLHNNVVQFGVVYDPLHNEFFHARAACGAFLNNKRLLIRPRSESKKIEVALGFTRKTDPALTITSLTNLAKAGVTFRIFGAGALMPCYIAANRIDGFFEHAINVWDIAASSLVASEAGAIHNQENLNIHGRRLFPYFVSRPEHYALLSDAIACH